MNLKEARALAGFRSGRPLVALPPATESGDRAGTFPLLGRVPGHIRIFLVVPVFVVGGATGQQERGGRRE